MRKISLYQGIPTTSHPKITFTASFLKGEFGMAILQEYKRRVQSDFDNSVTLDVLRYCGEVVKGSTPFSAVLINKILEEYGVRIAMPKDLEKIINTNSLPLQGFYEDVALVLRGEGEPNRYLAHDLSTQIKRRQKLEYPVMIPLSSLHLNSRYFADYNGLSFKLRDDAEIIYAPQLVNANNCRKFCKTDFHGLPIFDDKGQRNLYTTDSGLSMLYLYGNFDLSSGNSNLNIAGPLGRIVIVNTTYE